MQSGIAKVSFRPSKSETVSAIDAQVMLSDNYKAGSWCSYKDLVAHFNDDNLTDFIEKQLLITAKESYITHNTMGKIWSKFGSCFGVLAGLLAYEPVWEEYVKRIVLRCVEDGVGYLETRLLMITELFYDVDCNLRLSRRDSILIFLRGVEAAKKILAEQGKLDQFYGINVIYCTLRFFDPEEIWTAMLTCMEIYKEFPTLIRG